MSEWSSSVETRAEPAEAHATGVTVILPFSRPLWTYVILALITAIWLVTVVITAVQNGGFSTGALEVSTDVLITFGAKVNTLIAEGQFWRLVTANFLHVSLFHLLFNAYALWQLGVEVERVYGRSRFLVIYLLSGVYGATASYAFGGYLSAGASGAIFGLVGTLVAYFLHHRELFGRRGRAYLSNMLVIVVVNLFIGVTSPGIDNWGHIGGLVSGFLLGYGLVPIYAPPQYLSVGFPIRLRDINPLTRRVVVVGVALVMLVAMVVGVTAWRQDSADMLLLRGQRALDAGDWGTAESFLSRAAQKAPDRADVHFYLGVVQAHQGHVANAAAEWEKAAQLDPTEPNTLWNLALAYQALGRREDAITQLQRYIALVKDDASVARARDLIQQLQRSP
ncbi:MAG: rhomboid family intramembrane serine protease [Anaerolineae bacterium]|nr:rhomboid family intramembrane serine protease [Anaerolineae bacterium]